MTNILVFDFEVLPKEWLLVYADVNNKKFNYIRNDPKELKRVYRETLKDGIWVGYNCRFYDQYIFKAILLGLDPYKVSRWIITEGKPGWAFCDQFYKIPLVFFDIMFDRNRSLKQLEGFLGMDIEECDIPWDLDRPLTDDEFEQMLHYCIHDVSATYEVLLQNMDNFKAYIELIDNFNLPRKSFCKTKSQLASKIVGAKQVEHDDEWDIPLIDTVRMGRFEWLREWFSDPVNHDQEASIEFYVDDVLVKIAWGGAHGAADHPVTIKGRLMMMDVKSQYPSIIIEHGLMSRNVNKAGVKLYSEMRANRVEHKKSNPGLASAEKVVLNGTYGSMGDKHNALYDPRNMHAVCANGQLIIMDLADKVADHCQIVQINTDGILVNITQDNEDEIKAIAHEWEVRNRMDLEYDYYDEIIQKDVNNYIMVKDGKVMERKGGWVKACSPLDNDVPILRDGLVECLVTGKDPSEVVRACNDLISFQKVVKVGGMYHHCEHNGTVYGNKVYRVFASTDPNDGSLMKVKPSKNPEKVGNTPEHCFIENGKVVNVPIPKKLDRNWYVNALADRIAAFKGISIDEVIYND